MTQPQISIIIPAFNEGTRIDTVVQKLSKLPKNFYEPRIIVVDDGSLDQTMLKAQNAGALVIHHAINLGKGAALKTGCEAAVRLNSDIIVTMDGDGQHRAEDIIRLVTPLLQDKADIVFGSRIIDGNMPIIKLLGNAALSHITKLLFHLPIRDSQSGFRAFKTSILPHIAWDSSDYFVETEIIARVSRTNLRLMEVNIETVYHDHYKGTTIIDGLKILTKLLQYKFL